MGRTHRISSQDIAYIKGAGDFVELVLTSGETHLHSATLNDLEDELPAYFLRVHRSYIANSKLIESLQRNASGTGELRLHSNHALPVSRRIMPKIKAALQ
jgi:DNA-binding LytR/AlgR family response regulator